jgi:hypothetical protein
MSTEQARLRWRLGHGVRTPALILMVAVAATATMSCADSPLDLPHTDALAEAQSQAEAQLQAESNHTWRAGASPTWHGYHAPDVTASLGEASAALCVSWDDDFLFTRDGGKYAATDFFSFDLSWRAESAAGWASASVRNEAGSRGGCVALDAEAGETVEYTVKGMARFGTGRLASTHHTVAKHDQTALTDGSDRGDPGDTADPGTPADPLQGAKVLYFLDFTPDTDHIRAGLEALAAEDIIELTVASSRADLMARLANNPDVVVHFNQEDEHFNGAWTPLVDWVAAGNRLILADWQRNVTMLAALEAAPANGENGGGLVFSDDRLSEGVQQPMPLSSDSWGTFALPLAPTGDGVSVCAFDNGNGSSCMVLGNEGRTAAVGFLADVMSASDGGNLIRNLLRVLMDS